MSRNEARQESPDMRITTHEVLVDAVLRDKHQKLVRGLQASDFEVLEDGVPQQISAFRFVDGTEAASGNDQPPLNAVEPRKPHGLDPLRQINLISLAFMPSGTEGRVNFRNAARSLVGEALQPNTYMAVFLVDPYSGARMIQPFTDDPGVLLAAIERLASRPGIPDVNDIDTLLTQGQPYAEPMREPEAASHRMEPASALVGGSLARFGGEVMLELTSQRQLLGLVAFVKSLAELPGRKTVLLFSEGIQVVGAHTDLFRAAISAANRGQVTFYAFDLRNLSMTPESASSRGMLDQAIEESSKMRNDPNYAGSDAIGTVVDALHSYAPGNLEELAEATGGFRVMARSGTGESLRRIAEDMRTHYEIAYVPRSEIMDGRFRKIAIQVRRPQVTVQSRTGYYALPLLPGQTLLPFELGAMNALTAPVPPRAFAFHVSALRFRSGSQGTLFSLGYEIPPGQLKPAIEKEHKRFNLRVCFLSLIKNQQGEVVKKVSREVPFTGPLANLESFRRTSVIETQTFVLAPGRYTVESAVIAREQNLASTRRTSLVVPPLAPLQVSDLVLVHHLEENAGDKARQFDPLLTAVGRVIPALNPVIPGGAGTKMALYFQVYAHPSAWKPEISAWVQGDGVAAGNLTPKPLPPVAPGVLPYFAALNIGELSPGSYVAWVRVQQGVTEHRQSLAFEVAAPQAAGGR